MDDELLPSQNTSNSKRSSKYSNSTATNDILKAYQVNAFKFVNKIYENRGKAGLALLGSKQSNSYNLLLYGQGNTHLAQAHVNSEFEISVSDELYVSFYDMKSENWSLRFDSMDSFMDFLSRICVYKMCSNSKSGIATIDVKQGTGQKAQETNWCEIDLNVNVVKNGEIGASLFSSSNQDLLRTQIGSNKLMLAVEKSLIGMSKNGSRLVGVTPKSSLIKGGSITIPADSSILLNIKLVRMKTKVEKPIVNPPKSDIELALPDLNFGEKSNDFTELKDSEESKKNKLMSQMLRMGQPLPALVSKPQNIITTYQELQSNDNQFSNVYERQIMPVNQPLVNPPLTVPHMYNPSPMVSSIPITTPSNDFSILFSETRQNNTEMRVIMSKLQDKMDKILEKIDLKTNDVHPGHSVMTTRHMDAENVFDNIKRIINENETLKMECSLKADIIDKQNKKLVEMERKNQVYLEESHEANQRKSVLLSSSATEHQTRILQLEEEKLNYIRALTQKTGQLSESELKLEQAMGNAQSYRTKSLEYNEQINQLTEEVGDVKLKNRSLMKELDDLRSMRISDSVKQNDLEQYRKQWSDQEVALQNKIESLKNNLNNATNKMNQIQTDCDAEINEIRQQCQKEIEEWKTKLKLERQRINSKSSDLRAEIEEVNQNWEKQLESYRETESLKLSKLTEQQTKTMTENSNLRHELSKLTEKVQEYNELKNRNQILLNQSGDIERQLSYSRNIESKNQDLELEITMIRLEIKRLQERVPSYETLLYQNEQLKIEMHNERVKLESSRTDESLIDANASVSAEEKVKKIMNDVFKKIKEEIKPDKEYSGKEVINKCLIIIRDITIQIMAGDQESEDESDDNEEPGDLSESDKEPEFGELGNKAPETINETLIENEDKNESTDVVLESNEFQDKVDELVSKIPIESGDKNESKDKLLEVNKLQNEVAESISEVQSDDVTTECIPTESTMKQSKSETDPDLDSQLNEFESSQLLLTNENIIIASIQTEGDILSLLEKGKQNDSVDILETEVVNSISPDLYLDSAEISEVTNQSDNLHMEIPATHKPGSLKADSNKDLFSGPDDNTEINNANIDSKKHDSVSSDEDVSDFFKKLSDKTKMPDSQAAVEKKTLDIDDELDWLNS